MKEETIYFVKHSMWKEAVVVVTLDMCFTKDNADHWINLLV